MRQLTRILNGPFRRRAVGLLAIVAVAAGLATAAGLMTAGCGSDAAADTSNSEPSASTAAASASAAATAPSVTTPASSPTSTSASTSASVSTSVATTGAALFDSSVVHDISVSFAQDDYDAMVAAYKNDATKDWIEATVTIDGTTYERVGMRLKGNSSLRGLANGRNNGPGGAVSAADPQGLPWLIRLDKNIKGQNHNGVADIVIRSNNSSTSLNEAVSLALLDEAGLASQRAIAVRYTVNGGTPALRLATELPNDTWMAEHFSASGALYKAEASGDYSYRGTDPDAYTDVFDQEAGKDNTDLTPLIEFLDFINNSDDATFNSTLADKVDVDSLATYLAMEELIANFDDIDGPGNNSYLYYDAATGRFTVVPWDHNLAFGGMGGNRGGGQAGRNPGAVQPGGDFPGGNAPAGNQGGMRGPRGKSNLLVQRFHANAEFEALYQQKLAQLKKDLYGSGLASDVLAIWVKVLKEQASDLVDAVTIDSEASRISAYFQAG